MLRRFIWLIPFLFLCQLSFAQWQISRHTLEWREGLNANYPDSIPRMEFKGYATQEKYARLPLYGFTLGNKRLAQDGRYYITHEKVRPVTTEERLWLDDYAPLIDTFFVIHAHVAEYRGQYFQEAKVLPIRKNQHGDYEILLEFQVMFNPQEQEEGISSKKAIDEEFKTESVLSKPGFVKMRVDRSGVYKITYEEMLKAGYLQEEIPSADLRLFGQKAGMLPRMNVPNIPDDLQEIAIKVEDRRDGKFGPGDYVLFYGEASTTWSLDTQKRIFTHQINYYTKPF